MKTARLFRTGRSQAVRLPKEYRFEGSGVYIARMGSAVVLMPEKRTWDVLFEACSEFSEDFMAERNQPEQQVRPALEP
jgi:antitoxin VapB